MTAEENEKEREGDRRKSERRATTDDKAKKSGSNLWFILSFALTAVIIGWGFSLPFRKHEKPLLLWEESDLPRDPADGIRKVRFTKEQTNAYRAAAIQRDREFLRERRDRLRQTSRLPDADDAEQAHDRHVQSVKKAINQLRDAPEKSLQGDYRKRLVESLDAAQ